jgi:1-deoxy-D-xylulose-5-phosphate synthase
MNILQTKFPARTFDVGIAEQHAVTFAAGMASQGMVPFCNIYSSFLQRSYDQIIHDVAIQNLSVIFCIDRGGLVGEDGATHHGVFDLSYLRCIPNLIVSAPMNEEELRNLMYTAQSKKQGPFAIRYPRTNAVNVEWKTPFKLLTIGKGRAIKEGTDLAIVSIGYPGNLALKAISELEADHCSVALYDMRFLKPIDEELLHQVFSKHKKVITIEDGTILGGLGSAVIEFMNQHGYHAEVVRLGVPDHFIEHGSLPELYKECGFDEKSIIEAVKKLLGK